MKSYFFLVILLLLTTIFAFAQDQAPKTPLEAKKYTIENCINQFDTAKTVKTSVGYQYWFIAQKFLEDGLTVKMSVVAPHQATHAAHKHEGDGKTTTGGAYTSFYCPVGSEHGISNAGSTELKYLVIRKYPVN